MSMPSPQSAASAGNDPIERILVVLRSYAEPLVRSVASRLFKPRNQWPVEELIDRIQDTLKNAPVLDRRLKDLPVAARHTLAIFGLSRCHRWRIGHLLSILATLGHTDGLAPILNLLECALLYPDPLPNGGSIKDFESRLGLNGITQAYVSIHPFVASRSKFDEIDIDAPQSDDTLGPPARQGDGLEWLLRLGIIRQQLDGDPIRLTQSQSLFKRDMTRLQNDESLQAPFIDSNDPVPDLGLLALSLARSSGLLQLGDQELHVGPFPAVWNESLSAVLKQLASSISRIEDWDPCLGGLPESDPEALLPSVSFLILFLLSRLPAERWSTSQLLAEWIVTRHPSWPSKVKNAAAQAETWVQHFLFGLAYPLQLIEVRNIGDELQLRLSPLGRNLYAGGPEPAAAPEFRQTLMVQPNNEIIAFRQGLNPKLIQSLTRFAKWKSLSSACMLELQAEQVYRGLESGFSLKDIIQLLSQHGMKPMPPVVQDALQRWANKRDRITVYGGAVLIEFTSAAELDAAFSRGLVEIKLTDRIGLVTSESSIDYKNFRLIGNRDYENRPQQCVTFDDDGVSFTVDVAQADLLLEAELGRFAETLDSPTVGFRRYRLTTRSLQAADASGYRLSDLEQWAIDRSGKPLSAAAKLLMRKTTSQTAQIEAMHVVSVISEEVADGIWQWPTTRELLQARLGPVHFAVAADQIAALQTALAVVQIELRS
ncbi:general transcription factor IIH subunit TFB2 family [Tuwongella immobilis]|uniref:Helicase XPB/Ssl2 N-terminal domain-containing protein n=1 Tax=Tuwongella immobilis TaxID=692036 RepID=A0A6C2YM33_9BACT|nr:hypothetical protein [Tuwongella immobilis]VIP02424.1 Uncharacterized protein OS=Singulisphaera acidiphila (strain ATCC BAA-1392 / DSM 18658 / VKM B-2454 / MOB10) GN=Sinac_6345 PE=4 SV=1: Helicase_C_3 [Tuwongella immobilis]VTS01356.1 Uncharacterized protein OS=Singulisphaera acidiphila (strain ATCC BAA-1392 / DSM 18658 / VKM B-2454 / MOB10) GN=Sinac_6345 PE=4 SV=1: Helicase_C_3 [Tuwongella immobilis]